ncbi:hypothetical protein [Halovivax sp.]|uniref:hypothetical protein n=1 Tax=Halovivax sp. TaxID=1935978 RepID=UPI0025B9E3BA|nr:hypothetical protein [Halovivax sp.]
MQLTPLDERLLSTLGEGPASERELAAAFDEPTESVVDRLDGLLDNDLVESADGTVRLTDSGRRVLAAPGDGTADDRIDVPERVRESIERMGLRADREDALLATVSFLRYWGAATAAEIVDAIYSAHPADYDSPVRWWNGFVRDALASIPDVSPPDDGPTPALGSDAAIPNDWNPWTWDGETDRPRADGRAVLGDPEAFASAKHALEALNPPSDVRRAAHGAFTVLLGRGTMRETDLQGTIRTPENAPDEWWTDEVQPVLVAIPGVERTTDDGEPRWRYRAGDAGTSAGVVEPPPPPAACPVCGQPFSGRVFITAEGTIVPERRGRTCVATLEGGIATYYHRDR